MRDKDELIRTKNDNVCLSVERAHGNDWIPKYETHLQFSFPTVKYFTGKYLSKVTMKLEKIF